MLSLGLLAGCQTTGYLAEQSVGQLRLLLGRQSVEQVLQRKTLPKGWRRKLHLVQLAREYAFDEIGLKRTDSYTLLYDTGGKSIAHNLSVAPKDRLAPHTWRFPIVGALPYLGFFDHQSGKSMQAKYERQGFDSYLRPVSAFSSLGYFADPIFSTMLDGSADRLVELVIHESTHTTIFLRGEVGFNESLAVFVGQQGTIELLSQLHGPKSPQVTAARGRFARRQRFAQLIEELASKLRQLYARPITRAQKLEGRERLFRWAKQRYRQKIGPQGRFLRQKLNNAIVLSYGRYLRGLGFQRRVFRCASADLGKMMALYKWAVAISDTPVRRVAEACRLPAPPPQRM